MTDFDRGYAQAQAEIVAWLRSNGPDRDMGGPCRHVEHIQGTCTCGELADAIEAGHHRTIMVPNNIDGMETAG